MSRITRKTRQTPVESPGFLSPPPGQDNPSVSSTKKTRSGRKVRRTQDLMGLSFAADEKTEAVAKTGKKIVGAPSMSVSEKRSSVTLQSVKKKRNKTFISLNDEEPEVSSKVAPSLSRNCKTTEEDESGKRKLNTNFDECTKIGEESAMDGENTGKRKIVKAKRVLRNRKVKQVDEDQATENLKDASNNINGREDTSNSSSFKDSWKKSVVSRNVTKEKSLDKGFPAIRSSSKGKRTLKENCFDDAELELDAEKCTSSSSICIDSKNISVKARSTRTSIKQNTSGTDGIDESFPIETEGADIDADVTLSISERSKTALKENHLNGELESGDLDVERNKTDSSISKKRHKSASRSSIQNQEGNGLDIQFLEETDNKTLSTFNPSKQKSFVQSLHTLRPSKTENDGVSSDSDAESDQDVCGNTNRSNFNASKQKSFVKSPQTLRPSKRNTLLEEHAGFFSIADVDSNLDACNKVVVTGNVSRSTFNDSKKKSFGKPLSTSKCMQMQEDNGLDSELSVEESDVDLDTCTKVVVTGNTTRDSSMKKSFAKSLPTPRPSKRNTLLEEHRFSTVELVDTDLDLDSGSEVVVKGNTSRSTFNDSKKKSFGKSLLTSTSMKMEEDNGTDSESSVEVSDSDLDARKKVSVNGNTTREASKKKSFAQSLPIPSKKDTLLEEIGLSFVELVDADLDLDAGNTRSTHNDSKKLSSRSVQIPEDCLDSESSLEELDDSDLDDNKPTKITVGNSKEAESASFLVETLQSPVTTPDTTFSLSFTKKSGKESQECEYAKTKSGDFLMVSTLPSPISPSERSTENTPSDNKYLDFKSSHEKLNPSTSGAVTTKRRTYELEESVIDISSLKSLSDRDSKRMSSVSSDCKTPAFSKVTTRRRWNKSNNFSPLASKLTPSWVNKSPECIIITDSVDRKKSSTKKFVSKVKIPNFAAIHQKALDKIESLSEYKDRKDARAKMLLAGGKPKTGQKTKQESPLVAKESRKKLRFALGTAERQKSPTFIPLPSTPLPKAAPLSHIPVFDFANLKPVEFSKENIQNRIPALKAFQKESPKEARVLKPVNQRNVFTLKAKNCEVQKNQIKSIVTKSKPVVDSKEARRCAVKGIRTNRRFELLMNMRKGK